MKITVYYEDNRDRTTIEVPDEDCEIWVENDYQQRLAAAEDKASVTRRTPQQIMDEECNKPTYNNEHRETRRHVSFDALDPMGDTLIGEDGVDLGLGPDGFEYLERAIKNSGRGRGSCSAKSSGKTSGRSKLPAQRVLRSMSSRNACPGSTPSSKK